VALIAPVLGLDARAQDSESQSRARRMPRPIPRLTSPVPVDAHTHTPRLCAWCMTERYLELRPARRSRVSAELVAARIRRAHGNVWPAVVAYGISYRHALAIRAGFRGEGRLAEPIPYSAGGWTNGRRNGWAADRLRLLPGGRDELGTVVRRAISGASA
jgi:hypothetical protein